MAEKIDGMILAAGRGTRLAPLTDTIPKGMVDVGDRPMIANVAERLIDAGVTRLVVNTHHLGQQISNYLHEVNFFGVEGCISEEREDLLDTGGGLWGAADCFRNEAPFFLHNVDVLSTIDLRGMYDAARTTGSLVTLAVTDRDSTRYLAFDNHGLCGHGNRANGSERMIREPEGSVRRTGFCGVHVISPRIFELISERGVFSIIPLYLRLAAEGEQIVPWDIGDAIWHDIGTFERLEQARSTARELAATDR